MAVTKGNFNPVDRILYELRSLTNTVDSFPLIVSSIGSKQLALPLDSLLLDIRYGSGTFLKTLNEAKLFYQYLFEITSSENIKTRAIYTPTDQIIGSCIGNCWEVLEALSLMRNENESYGEVFDNIALTTQQNLVTKMTSELLNLEFNVPLDEIEKNCKELFSNGEVFQAFLELLEIHSVSKSTIKKIKNGEKWFDDKLVNRYSIKSKKEGYLSAIN